MSDNDHHHYEFEEELSDIRDQLEKALSNIQGLSYELELARKKTETLAAETETLKWAVAMLSYAMPFNPLSKTIDKFFPHEPGHFPLGDAVRNSLGIPKKPPVWRRFWHFLGY